MRCWTWKQETTLYGYILVITMTISMSPDSDGLYGIQGMVSEKDLEGHNFSELKIVGDVIFDRANLNNVVLESDDWHISFKRCRIDGIDITGKGKSGFDIDDCHVSGLHISGDFSEPVRIAETRLDGMTDLSGCSFGQITIIACNCEYMKATDICAEELDLTLSRFVQLFDLKGSALGKIILNDCIVLETFRLPCMHDENALYPIVMDNIAINGRIMLNLPGNMGFQKKFVELMYEHNNSSGLAAMRSVLESNRRFAAADLIFIKQKMRERDPRDTDYETNKTQRTVSFLSYIFSGNGMKPAVTLIWMAFLVIAFSIIYLIIGTASGYDVTGTTYGDTLYLSVVSFFICSFFEADDLGTAFMITENIMGILMMIYFTVILTRKFIR